MIEKYDYGTDYYGYRKKFAVLVPSTNTAVETEYHMMKPEGIVLATRACVIPALPVNNDADFVRLVESIGAVTEQGLRDCLSCSPDHVIFGYSAETFWDGKDRSDREFARYNAIAREVGGCNITFGAQALQDALSCYPKARRLGVLTPYMPVGDQQVEKFLSDIGYEVVHIRGHRSPGPVEIAHEDFAKTRRLVDEINSAEVDLLLQAGTNLYFVELAAKLEQELGKPALAINAVTFWHALRSNGIRDRIRGFGSLLSEH